MQKKNQESQKLVLWEINKIDRPLDMLTNKKDDRNHQYHKWKRGHYYWSQGHKKLMKEKHD